MKIVDINGIEYLGYVSLTTQPKTSYFLQVKSLIPEMTAFKETLRNRGEGISYSNHISYFNVNGRPRGTISVNSLFETRELIEFSEQYEVKFPEYTL